MLTIAERRQILESTIETAENNIADLRKVITDSRAKLRKLERIEKEINLVFGEEQLDEETTAAQLAAFDEAV